MIIKTKQTTITKKEKVIIPIVIERPIRYWKQEELITLITAYNNGQSYQDISKLIGRTISSCKSKIHELRN